MAFASPQDFEVHWSVVPNEDAGGMASPGCRMLAIWPAPVNHDACFAEAGFTLFGDNDEAWDRAAEGVLSRVIATLSRFGAPRLLSKPLREGPPWYLRLVRAGRELSLPQQALWPMQWDSLPPFHACFGNGGAALRTGNGHFLLWVGLPDGEPAASEFVGTIAQPWAVVETRLRWHALLPSV